MEKKIKTEKEMSGRNKKILLIMAVIVFAVVLAMFVFTIMRYWPYWFGVEKYSVYTSITISNSSVGFDVNKTALTFGSIKAGNVARRGMIFTNNYIFPVVVKITTNGNISDLLDYDNPVYADVGETKNITFQVAATENTSLGDYNGYVHFKVFPAT